MQALHKITSYILVATFAAGPVSATEISLAAAFLSVYQSPTPEDFWKCFAACCSKSDAYLHTTKHLIRDGHVDLLAGILQCPSSALPLAIIFDDRDEKNGPWMRFLVHYQEFQCPGRNGFAQFRQATSFKEAVEALSMIGGVLKHGEPIGHEALASRAERVYNSYAASYDALRVLNQMQHVAEDAPKTAFNRFVTKHKATLEELGYSAAEWTCRKNAQDCLKNFVKAGTLRKEFLFQTRLLRRTLSDLLSNTKKSRTIKQKINTFNTAITKYKKACNAFGKPAATTIQLDTEAASALELQTTCEALLVHLNNSLMEDTDAFADVQELETEVGAAFPEVLLTEKLNTVLVPTVAAVLQRAQSLVCIPPATVTHATQRQDGEMLSVGVILKETVSPDNCDKLIGTAAWGLDAISFERPADVTAVLRSDTRPVASASDSACIDVNGSAYDDLDPYLATFFLGDH